MKNGGLSTEQWLTVALEALKDSALGSFAAEGVFVTPEDSALAAEHSGAYVPLMAGDESMQVGLLTSEAGCEALTRALLAMEPDEAAPGLEDVVDAVGEIVNIVAGVMQRQLAEEGLFGEIGLPIFVEGHVVH
ncbi:MAG: chemotaxis protein CheX, partial [Planctomycetota bacterium]|nr:chemotaxis protein CheX [Planctomycetota bacterium]